MQGIAASPGIAIGKIQIINQEKLEVDTGKIDEDMVVQEINIFKKALKQTEKELEELRKHTEEKLGSDKGEIFETHLMFLEDPEFISGVEREIKENKCWAAAAVSNVFNQFISLLSTIEDEYMLARQADMKDVSNRIISIINGREKREIEIDSETVMIARDLTPSDTAQLDTEKVVAFVTCEGSRTSHTAIMARSLGIPAVVGVGLDLLEKARTGGEIVVDGNKGCVFINPDIETTEKYQQRLVNYLEEQLRLKNYKEKKAVTRDGEEVKIAGNIGSLNDLDTVLETGVEGIGLFRTEFLFMGREQIPSEDEQFKVYKNIAERMSGKPVIIRTLDIGGDKELPYLKLPAEMNPFLGYRAIRLCIDRPEIFKPQLKALLRASVYGNIKIMYPLISSLEELKAANQILTECKGELEEKGHDYNPDLEIGIMIEVPSAVMIADLLAKEVDFFSIGTNDLIQYALAVDRTNEKVAGMHTPYHPAILRLIKKTIDAGHKQGIWVGMCGEAAGDELLLPFLLGAGLDEFSMSAVSILKIKALLSNWTRKEAAEITEKVLELNNMKDIKKYLKEIKKESV